ncbi:MAG: squalene/phytoene synthase family protein [bacterium]|nr:squalene/phytoene synthase family protein [bacterium]
MEQNTSVAGIPDFQEVLTNPILDIAARFWEDERYKAFTVCYRSMRAVDDLIDNRKASGLKLSDAEKKQISSTITEWVSTGAMLGGSIQKKLDEVRGRFRLPAWPWQKLSRSMIYDVNHEGFESFPAFLEYSEGAAVAPASIFMHLCGVAKNEEDYHPPKFDVIEAARPLARFCYLVHIIRDFQKDQDENLNYFANNLLEENGLTSSELKEIAAGAEISPEFRRLMGKYHGFAEQYRAESRAMIDRVGVHLESRYLLSLEIIFGLYSLIFERIDVSGGRFTTAELNPSEGEIKERINKVVLAFASSKD